MASKYTKEVLEPVVRSSASVAQVLVALGVAPTGGSHGHISRMIRNHGLDTSHFTGKGYLRGKASPKKLSPQELLVMNRNKGQKDHPSRLRRALVESGVPYTLHLHGVQTTP